MLPPGTKLGSRVAPSMHERKRLLATALIPPFHAIRPVEHQAHQWPLPSRVTRSSPQQVGAGNPAGSAVPRVQLTETAQPGAAAAAAVWPPADLAQLGQLLKELVKTLPITAVEVAGLFFVGAFLLNMLLGTGANEKIAIAWAKTFCEDGLLLERNFAQLAVKGHGATEVRLSRCIVLPSTEAGFHPTHPVNPKTLSLCLPH